MLDKRCLSARVAVVGVIFAQSCPTIVLVPWCFCWGYFCKEESEQLFWCLDAFVGVTFAKKYQNNCFGVLMLLLGLLLHKVVQVFLVSMLHWSIFKDGLYLQSIMLPHELFHCMWKEYKEYFIHALAPGGSNRLVSFWKNFEKHPCMQSGAMTAIRQHRSYPHVYRCCDKVLVHMPNV